MRIMFRFLGLKAWKLCHRVTGSTESQQIAQVIACLRSTLIFGLQRPSRYSSTSWTSSRMDEAYWRLQETHKYMFWEKINLCKCRSKLMAQDCKYSLTFLVLQTLTSAIVAVVMPFTSSSLTLTTIGCLWRSFHWLTSALRQAFNLSWS